MSEHTPIPAPTPIDDGGPAYPELTVMEHKALVALAGLADKFPANTYGFLPSSLGARTAAAARRLDARGFGFVRIARIAENCFRYAITEAGRDALAHRATLLSARKGGGDRA